ncbi:Ig-like domain-containing protein [Alloscardovia omnicolens]|uniref:Ig-like domain-containing protein n=1 Tax=Alloscardovia omnicolens TaxID=419015 RepID=UPI003A6242A7
MKRYKNLAAFAAATLLAVGVAIPTATSTPSALAADAQTITVTPNPWITNGPFEGWGTSLAWFANATGKYGEEGFITNRDDISDTAYKKALANGKKLREEFYNSIFSEEGLDLNMARYNIGGGNASDVAYEYPFMRQGAAVPGYWAEDPTGSKKLYGGAATTQENKDKIAQAFDPQNDAHYDWSKGSSQEWWIEQGHKTGDITHLESFANSAPWFLTTSGYATGGSNASVNNLQDPEKFGQYLVTVTNHLEKKYNLTFNTIEAFNESEAAYWATPGLRADADYNAFYNYTGGNASKAQDNIDLVERYWQRYFTDKNKSVTPYSTDVKKPQEGMHVDNNAQQATIKAMHAAMDKNDTTMIVATDATDSGHMVNSYNAYSPEVRSMIGQYNTHSYGTNNQRVARDIAQSEGKKLSMSEVDGAWQNGGFNPYEFSNGLGMAGKINSDIYALQSKDFNFWQVVEDLYNMATGSEDIYGNTANPAGENTNWGTVFISFDCTVADNDGNLYSERDVDNNGGKTDGLQPCSVIVNSKYNAVRAYTKFVHEGDYILANDHTSDTLTAQSKDGKTQKIIHTNPTGQDQTFVIDLSQFGKIDENAAGKLFLTTSPTKAENSTAYFGATPAYMNKFSNVEKPQAVTIDAQAKTATVTIPARSIASLELTGITGVADNAGIKDSTAYELVGEGSQKNLAAHSVDDSALSLQDSASSSDAAASQTWTFHEVAAPAERPSLHQYVITGPDNKVLIARNDTNALETLSVDEAKKNDAAVWIINTENGTSFSLVNRQAQKALDVNGQGRESGTKVGLWNSGGGAHQAWYVRSVLPQSAQDVTVHTAVGVEPELPDTVTVNFDWGTTDSSHVTWNTENVSTQVKEEGTFDITGIAQTARGETVPVTAHVHVGSFTVTDPASITVGVGTSTDELISTAPTTVHAHVKSSPAFDTSVKWDFSKVTNTMLAQPGHFTVSGLADSASASSDNTSSERAASASNTLPATLTVYVTERNTPENIAPAHARASASSTEGNYVAALTIDNNLATKWSNWRSGGGDDAPWLLYELDKAYPIEEVHFYVDQTRAEAAPRKVVVEKLNDDGTWSEVAQSSHVETEAGKPTVISLPPDTNTSAIRLNLTYSTKAEEDYFAKVAEVKLMAKINHSPASDASLGDLRIDGTRIANFNPTTHSYTVALADNTVTYPLVQAFTADTAASLSIEQPSKDNNGKARIYTTSADGSQSEETIVDFGPLPDTTETPDTPNPEENPGDKPDTGQGSENNDQEHEDQENNTPQDDSPASDEPMTQNQSKQTPSSDNAHSRVSRNSTLALTGSAVVTFAILSASLSAIGMWMVLRKRVHKDSLHDEDYKF